MKERSDLPPAPELATCRVCGDGFTYDANTCRRTPTICKECDGALDEDHTREPACPIHGYLGSENSCPRC